MESAARSASKNEIAIEFLRQASSGRLDEAYAKVSANFRHHNPYFKGDAESLKAGMAEAHEKFPNTTLQVQHALADGDIVAVHSRVSHGPNQPDIAVVHLLRFEGDRIAELWDVAVPAPDETPNENGLF